MAMQEGGRRSRRIVLNLKDRLLSKKSIIQIQNKDNMCCPRAIVTGFCRIEKHPNWNSIRRGYKEQRTYAEDLYRQAGIPINTKCGIEEIKNREYRAHDQVSRHRCLKGTSRLHLCRARGEGTHHLRLRAR